MRERARLHERTTIRTWRHLRSLHPPPRRRVRPSCEAHGLGQDGGVVGPLARDPRASQSFSGPRRRVTRQRVSFPRIRDSRASQERKRERKERGKRKREKERKCKGEKERGKKGRRVLASDKSEIEDSTPRFPLLSLSFGIIALEVVDWKRARIVFLFRARYARSSPPADGKKKEKDKENRNRIARCPVIDRRSFRRSLVRSSEAISLFSLSLFLSS